MNMITPFLMTMLLATVHPAFAHTDGGVYGTPKTYCENLKGDTNVHDYAVNGATGVAYLLWNLVDGNAADCDGDGAPNDFDGHSEWSIGGAYLLSGEVNSPISGATACFGEGAHHGIGPSVWIFDQVWPTNVLFLVGADTTSSPFTNPTTGIVTNCGDGVDDVDTGYCLDHCSVGFAPGTDGAYHVYVVNEIQIELDPCFPHVWIDFDPVGACILWEGVSAVNAHFAQAGHVYT